MTIHVFKKGSGDHYIFDNADDFEIENETLNVWDYKGEKHQFTNAYYSVDYGETCVCNRG